MNYVGEEFAPVFYRAMAEWHDGGCVGANPTMLWECKDITPLAGMLEDNAWDSRRTMPTFVSAYQYRWKPNPKRMVTIGYQNKSGMWIEKTLVAPETIAPENNVDYWTLFSLSHAYRWEGIPAEFTWLKDGRVFLAHEDAQAMVDWLAVCCNGGGV
jgi:hypothetical protein